MKIINYKKTKNNLYEISLDNDSKIKLYDEIILKSGLLLKKEIDLKTLNNLIDDNKYYELHNSVIKYISHKMRSEKEIYNKFKDYNKEDIKKVIDKLKEQNYINENDYIKAYINDSINLKMIGYNKIKSDLINLGLKEDQIIEQLDKIDSSIWYTKIKKLVDNLVKNNHRYSALMLKQKIINNLISKGFNKEDIIEYFDSIDLKDDNNIYEKEYNKLKTKLSKKYSGEELEWEIKKRLKNKGF